MGKLAACSRRISDGAIQGSKNAAVRIWKVGQDACSLAVRCDETELRPDLNAVLETLPVT